MFLVPSRRHTIGVALCVLMSLLIADATPSNGTRQSAVDQAYLLRAAAAGNVDCPSDCYECSNPEYIAITSLGSNDGYWADAFETWCWPEEAALQAPCDMYMCSQFKDVVHDVADLRRALSNDDERAVTHVLRRIPTESVYNDDERMSLQFVNCKGNVAINVPLNRRWALIAEEELQQH